MNENRLGRETSPYLLQHKDNPVHWQPWDAEALAQAKRENKPILLSIGYAACHWCHVMAHESFADDDIATLMNELFVNIKVDREERPDLDSVYQNALALLGEHGGWPLTMFLTPNGEPFWGGTYFPPRARYGRPGFAHVLRQVHEIYRRNADQVAINVEALRNGLGRLAQSSPGAAITLEAIDDAAGAAVQSVDPVLGGTIGAPKFPQRPFFEFLWRAYLRGGGVALKNAVLVTLERMCQGGIYDHLGGGFARYATDAAWLAPHFEKMLYDNAQLIELLALVWRRVRWPLLEARLRETVAWVLREMVADGGGFAATLDADSDGEEGKFYVWDEAEIDALLGEDSALFKQAYDVSHAGNWEGHNILNRSRVPDLGDPAAEARLGALRKRLWTAREQRPRPGWDDKVLADWNGLMITALADAGAVFGEAPWIEAAVRAFAFVRDRMTIDGRLRHSHRNGQSRHGATLDDHANMAEAALALAEATGEQAYLQQAAAWVAVLDTHYWDGEGGGYFFTADDAEPLLVRTKSITDNATPAGNAVMVGVLARLYHLTGTEAYRERAHALVTAFAGQFSVGPLALATFLNNVELLIAGLQIVIVGDPAGDDRRALLAAARAASPPARTILTIAPGAKAPAGHPAAGKGQIDGKATAYLCEGQSCSLPLTDPGALVARLEPAGGEPATTTPAA